MTTSLLFCIASIVHAHTTTHTHVHNSQTGEGGPLQFDGSITTGTSVQVNGGTEVPLESNINLRALMFG